MPQNSTGRQDPCESSLSFVPDLSAEERVRLQSQTAQALGLPTHFRDRLRDGGEGPEMVVIPPGMFEMGSPRTEFGHRPEEAPQVYVCIQRPLAFGRYVVTAEEWAVFQRDTGWRFRSDLIRAEGRHPVINIRIDEARRYCRWLSKQTGRRYRLPTEAEWEYAARAGSTGPFCFGEHVSCREVHFNAAFPYQEARQGRRWFLPRCMPKPGAVEVGSKPPNLWGLHEVHGNVWEFTDNPWTDSHVHTLRDGSIDPAIHSKWVVVKGGSWFDPAVLSRSAARRPRLRDELDVNLGFRLVRELA